MNRRLILSICFLLLLGIFLHAQTLEAFPKRFSIEAGFSQHLLPAEEYLIAELQNAGYLESRGLELNRRVPYVVFQFRLTDQLSAGFKISKFQESDYYTRREVPEQCMPNYFCWSSNCADSICDNSLLGWIQIYPVDYNEFQVKWHNSQNKLGLHVGVVLYKYGYRLTAEEEVFGVSHDIFDLNNSGVGASFGGFINVLSVGKRLHLVVNSEYYLIPNFTIKSVSTVIGTFSETKVNLSQINVGLGIKVVLL